MKIVVLAGGLSPERDVSLSSGALISNALIENGHDVMLLDLYLGKNNKEIEPIYRNKKSAYRYSYAIPEQEPNLGAIRASSKFDECLIGEEVIDFCKKSGRCVFGFAWRGRRKRTATSCFRLARNPLYRYGVYRKLTCDG